MLRKNIFLTLIFFILITPASAEKKGHPALSRYKGAKITAYRVQDYAPYVLALDNQEQKSERFRGLGRYFADYMDLEGKLTRIQYRIPGEEGLYKVFKNYENALENAGYQVLFTTSEKESSYPFWNEDVYHHENGINALRGEDFKGPFGRSGFRFITAKGVYKGNNIYFAIFMNTYENMDSEKNILVTQDIIEINPMESGLVTAEKIENNIELSGFVSIYGVHFDTGKWNIKKDSRPALKEIAKFLKTHPEGRYYIVGHTDNAGNFPSNMKLSEKRAKAVMNELIKNYGIDKNRLKAYGVSSLSPVTSNKTAGSRAKNRRVEIVEQ